MASCLWTHPAQPRLRQHVSPQIMPGSAREPTFCTLAQPVHSFPGAAECFGIQCLVEACHPSYRIAMNNCWIQSTDPLAGASPARLRDVGMVTELMVLYYERNIFKGLLSNWAE